MPINHPTDIADCRLVLLAESLSGTHADGAQVAQWDDESGLGNHAVQATAASRPLFVASHPDYGWPALHIPAKWMVLPNGLFTGFTAAAGAEIFVVVKTPDPGTSSNGFWRFDTVGQASHYAYSNGNIYESFCHATARLVVNPALSMAAVRVYNVGVKNNDRIATMDGGTIYADAAVTAGARTTDIWIGRAASGDMMPTSTYVFAYVIYNRKLTALERADVVDWLSRYQAVPPPPDTKPNTPTVSVSAFTNTSVSLAGTPFIDPDDEPHAASQWQIQLAGGDWSAPVVDSGTDAVNLLSYATGAVLGSNTDYEARARYMDDSPEWSDWSVAVAFTTALNDPSAFAEPAADAIEANPVAVSWSAFDFNKGNPVDYDVDYSSDDGATWDVLVADTATLTAEWSAPAALYGLPITFRVRARDTVTAQLSDYGYVSFQMLGAVGYETVVLADNPLEYWRLEETIGDFLTSSPVGYDAPPDGSTFLGIASRGISAAICKGIDTFDSRSPPCKFFETERPYSEVFVDEFTIEQWVKPEVTTAFTVPVGVNGLSVGDRVLVNAAHPNSGVIPDAGIGLGLEVGTNGICVRQHSGGNLQPASTYQGPISSTEWHQVVVRVRKDGVTRYVELYLDGQYCGDLAGVYDEWSITATAVASWPQYGEINYNAAQNYYYGWTYQGGIDEVSWYDYTLTPEQIARHYTAGLVPSIAAAGAFTAPAGNVAVGSPTLVEWGAAVGADGYLLELWKDGAWAPIAATTDPEYLWTPEETSTSAQLRVIGTFDGYTDPCSPEYVESAVFYITSSADTAPPARRAWAFTLDGHIFYVIGSFDDMTLLYDGTTGQWCRWKTGNRRFWNMHRGIMWRGRVLAADVELPIVWELDPATQLDEEATVITRAVTGFQPHRGDASIRQGSLRMIARQQTGAAVDASITLRYSDDGGRTWSPERTLLLTDAAARLEFRSLGRIRKPGRIWEITDTGGLIRIDGLEAVLEGSDG